MVVTGSSWGHPGAAGTPARLAGCCKRCRDSHPMPYGHNPSLPVPHALIWTHGSSAGQIRWPGYPCLWPPEGSLPGLSSILESTLEGLCGIRAVLAKCKHVLRCSSQSAALLLTCCGHVHLHVCASVHTFVHTWHVYAWDIYPVAFL